MSWTKTGPTRYGFIGANQARSLKEGDIDDPIALRIGRPRDWQHIVPLSCYHA
jgi:hypothetical protein